MSTTRSSRVVYALSIACFLIMLPRGLTPGAAQQAFVADKFFKETVGLDSGQIESVHRGKAIATSLDSPNPDQVFIIGTVLINATPESYLKLASNLDVMRKLPGYLAVQKFSNPPRRSDVAGFSIDSDDLKELKTCKPGECEVQLPSESMEQFQKTVDWNASDATSQANRLAQQMTLDALLAYQKGGNAALGVYR